MISFEAIELFGTQVAPKVRAYACIILIKCITNHKYCTKNNPHVLIILTHDLHYRRASLVLFFCVLVKPRPRRAGRLIPANGSLLSFWFLYFGSSACLAGVARYIFLARVFYSSVFE